MNDERCVDLFFSWYTRLSTIILFFFFFFSNYSQLLFAWVVYNVISCSFCFCCNPYCFDQLFFAVLCCCVANAVGRSRQKNSNKYANRILDLLAEFIHWIKLMPLDRFNVTNATQCVYIHNPQYTLFLSSHFILFQNKMFYLMECRNATFRINFIWNS